MRSNYGRWDISSAEGEDSIWKSKEEKEEEDEGKWTHGRVWKGLRSHRGLPSVFEYFLAAKFDCSPHLLWWHKPHLAVYSLDLLIFGTSFNPPEASAHSFQLCNDQFLAFFLHSSERRSFRSRLAVCSSVLYLC